MELDPQLKMYFEHVDQRFDTVVEVMTANTKKLEATFEAVGQLQEDMIEVKGAVGQLQEDMVEVKSELGLIRNELKAKADRSELQLLEQRVVRLERRALAA